jgi:DNA repair protein RadC
MGSKMTVPLEDNEKIKIINSDDLYKIMQQVLLRENKIDRDKEHFWVAGLAVNNKLLFIELISLGSQTATIVSPMEVFSVALQKRATTVILIHNHPTGALTPSEEDKNITDRLMVVGKIVDTPVLDHFIISEVEYLSFAKIGLIKLLAKSSKFLPSFMLEDEIKQQISEKVRVNTKIEIAREFKKQRIDEEIIAQCTGLEVEEIRAIDITDD